MITVAAVTLDGLIKIEIKIAQNSLQLRQNFGKIASKGGLDYWTEQIIQNSMLDIKKYKISFER